MGVRRVLLMLLLLPAWLALGAGVWSSPALAAGSKAPSLQGLRERRVDPVSGDELRELLIGQAVLIEELASGERFEAIFLDSGVRIFRPVKRESAGRALRQRGLSSVAAYRLEQDRVHIEAGERRYDFQLFRIGETLYGYRIEEGREAAGWLVTEREAQAPRYQTTRELAEDRIEPLDGAALRQLITGRTLTLLERSSGALLRVAFGTDGTRTLRDGLGRSAGDDDHYTVFQNQLVTEVDGRPAYISIYSTPEGFLAASSTDEGRVEWELLRRE